MIVLILLGVAAALLAVLLWWRPEDKTDRPYDH